MRIMLDTNIFISMIFFPSAQTRELARRLTESHQIVVCDYVIVRGVRATLNREQDALCVRETGTPMCTFTDM